MDKTVLVVEDDEVTREGMARALRSEGYGVVTAANGQEALDALRGGTPPDLILLDMMLPVQDGWRFLERRKQDPALNAVPVVILTALGVASPEWATGLGAVGFVKKPMDLETVAREIRRYF